MKCIGYFLDQAFLQTTSKLMGCSSSFVFSSIFVEDAANRVNEL